MFVVRSVAAFVGFSSNTTRRRTKTLAMKSSVFVNEFGNTNPIGEQSIVRPEIVLSTTFAEIMFTQLATTSIPELTWPCRPSPHQVSRK